MPSPFFIYYLVPVGMLLLIPVSCPFGAEWGFETAGHREQTYGIHRFHPLDSSLFWRCPLQKKDRALCQDNLVRAYPFARG